MLTDRFFRSMSSLRVSVTDRCDLRCRYCMPASGAVFAPRPELLGLEELRRSLELFLRLGITRFKFTGGEPLLRTDLESLIAAFAGRVEMGLTTNGTLLAGRAAGLWRAGLRRLTVSLDTLHPGHYAAMTRGGDVRRVLDGLRAAEAAGFEGLKLNAVLMDQPMEELLRLAALSVNGDWEIRFIEAMPVSAGVDIGTGRLHRPAELRAAMEAAFGPLESLDRERTASPATRVRIRGARGRLGFISSVSEPFCAACDRLRLQADGFLRLCMARPDGLPLRPLLRSGATDQELETAVRRAVWDKPSGHAFHAVAPAQGAQMSSIGG